MEKVAQFPVLQIPAALHLPDVTSKSIINAAV
jgi:hypothetical protein